MIDRQHIKNVFKKYVNQYDVTDGKIALKIAHTYRVAELSDQIAESIGLKGTQKDLAWVIGMLHDIGRFEQVKDYGTFNDALSVDHAKYGVKLLFEDGFIKDFLLDTAYYDCIRLAIFNHNEYRLPSDLTEEELIYCKIIRDADKIDILRVNFETPLEVIYNVPTQVLKSDVVSEGVMAALAEKKAIKHSIKKTSVDRVVGHVSLVFELEYPISKEIVKEQGYLEKLMNFPSDNQKTLEQFREIRDFVHSQL